MSGRSVSVGNKSLHRSGRTHVLRGFWESAKMQLMYEAVVVVAVVRRKVKGQLKMF